PLKSDQNPPFGNDGGNNFGEGGGGNNGEGGGGGEGDEEFGTLLNFEVEARGVKLPSDMEEAARITGIREMFLLRYLELQVGFVQKELTKHED
ncbi:hypothetical protein A2U01_0028965, partial [Trifolium medium]|nr:hypothetical protein [Trifolium medium]